MMKNGIRILCAIAFLCLIVGFRSAPKEFVAHQNMITIEKLRASLLQHDRSALRERVYRGVYLTMFPPESYSEEILTDYMGIESVTVAHRFTDIAQLRSFVIENATMWDTVEYAYLGIDFLKELEDANWDIQQTLKNFQTFTVFSVVAHSDIVFHFLYAYPPLSEWARLSEDHQDLLFQAYEQSFEILLSYSNTRVFFPGDQEWLIRNPANHDVDGIYNAEVARLIFAQVAFHTGMTQGMYMVDRENGDDKLDEIRGLLTKYANDPAYIDLHKMKIVFFGDSIIGNYRGSTSIPNVVSAFSGAQVYNCAKGGMAASSSDNSVLSFPETLDKLFDGSVAMLPQEEAAYQTMLQFRKDTKHFKAYRNICFVISFGLNDYFGGHPVTSSDSTDDASYYGALNLGVQKLMDKYPGATVIVLSPTYISTFSEGNEVMSEVGGTLREYRARAIQVALENDAIYCDLYTLLKINEENAQNFIPDGTHLNEPGRFQAGLSLLKQLEQLFIIE
ncbi:MAG: SGNH/GDSL hydrolase family protein [Lachnospiraceae bacterium]|jgi:lysophospholipase L1-like esterase|nr:SGNH/GDSL hydrolase family protein [Lachnospiraceae bacterium]